MGGSSARLLRRPDVRRLLRECAGLSVAVAVLVVAQWACVAAAITALVGGATPRDVGAVLAGALGAWAARAAVVALRDHRAARASSAVRASLRRDLVRALLRLGPGGTAGMEAGEVVTTATHGVAMLDPAVARWVPAAASAAVVPLVVGATVLVVDPLSAAVLAVAGPVVVVLLWLIGTRTAEVAQARWETLGRLGALLLDTVRVLPTLVTYGRARGAVAWLRDLDDAYRVTTMRVLRTAFLSGFVLELGATLGTALVAVTVGVRLFEDAIAFDRALLVLLLTPEFFAPLRTLGAEHHARLEGVPAAERVHALLDGPAVSGPGAVVRRAGPPDLVLRGAVVRSAGRTVIRGVDLHLPPRSRTALVGPSGAGKTTVARVLLGLLPLDGGELLVDGIPVGMLDADAWRARVAYVPERPWLTAGTVAENVRLGRPDATDADVALALRRAGAGDLLARLPRGAATVLGEDGGRLSGGERLRVALARAFVKDAAVVILDEPTSQLDAETEREVLEALDELARGRTLLTITHRPAPLDLHDRVVTLAGGRVVPADVPVPPVLR